MYSYICMCVCVYQKYYLQKLFYVWHPVLLFAELYFSIVYQRASALYNSKGPRSCFSKQRSSAHPERHSVFLPGLLTRYLCWYGEESCSAHQRIFSSISGLQLLDACSTLRLPSCDNKNVSRNC